MSFLDRTISDAIAPAAEAVPVRRAQAGAEEEPGAEEVETLRAATASGAVEEEPVSAVRAVAGAGGGAAAEEASGAEEEEETVQASRSVARRDAGSTSEGTEAVEEESVVSAARMVRRVAGGAAAEDEPEEEVAAVRRKPVAAAPIGPGVVRGPLAAGVRNSVERTEPAGSAVASATGTRPVGTVLGRGGEGPPGGPLGGQAVVAGGPPVDADREVGAPPRCLRRGRRSVSG